MPGDISTDNPRCSLLKTHPPPPCLCPLLFLAPCFPPSHPIFQYPPPRPLVGTYASPPRPKVMLALENPTPCSCISHIGLTQNYTNTCSVVSASHSQAGHVQDGLNCFTNAANAVQDEKWVASTKAENSSAQTPVPCP
jgi:hypothetical protein